MDEPPPDSTQTRRLLEQAQAGDRDAFDQLFAQHRASLRRFVELRLDPRLRPRVDASDVVQETQMEAFRRLPDFLNRRPMPFRLWLHKTAYERLLKLRRRHIAAAQRALGREVPLPDRSSLLLAQRLWTGSTPSEHLSRREIARRVNEALAQLPALDREILLMRGFDKLQYREIALLLGIESAAARQRYGRALLRLRKLLVESGLLESNP